MNIKFYKDCILNESYTEVFRTQNFLETYLGGLTSIEYDDTDDPDTIGDIYPKLSDTLYLPTEKFGNNRYEIFSYNYMCISNSSTTLPKIYAVISSIDITNEVVQITYTTDVWHTYLPCWQFRKGLLTKTLQTSLYDVDEYSYPVVYFSNTYLQETVLASGGTVYIVAELQLYEQVSVSAPPSSRSFVNVLITNASDIPRFYKGEFQDIIDKLITNQVDGDIKRYLWQNDEWVLQGTTKYNIVNCYIINTKFEYFSAMIKDNVKFQIGTTNCYVLNDRSNLIYTDELKAVDFNALTKSFGFVTHRFNYNFNGKDHELRIYMKCEPIRIRFFMEYDSSFIDITDDFILELPYQPITAENYQANLTNFKLNNLNFQYERENLKIQEKASLTQGAISMIGYGSSYSVADYNISNGKEGNFSGMIGSASSLTKSAENIFKTQNALTKNSIEQRIKNGQLYSGAQIENITKDTIINQFGNFSAYSYRDYSNKYSNINEANSMIYQVGYDVNKVVDEILEYINGNYDIVKFDFVYIVGCPTEINNIITNILGNGVKIWYTNNV